MPDPQQTQEDGEARKSVALTLHDAYLWTDQAQLDDAARGIFVGGLKLLIRDARITITEERKLLEALLTAGWYLAPASTGEPIP